MVPLFFLGVLLKQVMAIFGKLPQKGFSKTRLSKDVGEELALKLYKAFISDFAKNLENINCFETIYVFGTPSQLETQKYFQREFSKFKMIYFPQSEVPFFQRLAEVFSKIREAEGDCYIHLTGTDIPDFPFEQITKILPKKNTLYLGPDIDGGFYYVGGEAKFYKVFSFEIHGTILESISKSAKDLGLEVSHLKTWSDIDDLDGLKAVLKRSPREKISHTAALWPGQTKIK